MSTEIKDDTVTVSERAANRINAIVAADPSKPILRISVEGGGCSGFQYKFDLVETTNDDDVRVERNGAVVVVDSLSLMYMGGSEIDYVDDLIGASFQVKNPHATAGCGCGTSFSL